MHQHQYQNEALQGERTDKRIEISIIVPVYNNPRDLGECLNALKDSARPSSEIIVVDDACTDETPTVAARLGVRVLRLEKNSGPAAARNHGARHAEGDILFFVDADVAVPHSTVRRVAQFFEDHPDADAVFGSYDAFPRAQGLVSQYRNLLHHFVHQHGNGEASTFWAGCGAIRRSVFEKMGGFDEKRFPKSSIEDIELGYRLRQAGHHIFLDKGLQGTHLKRWTLLSIIRTDIACRAIPWSRLILESKNAPNDLNLREGQAESFALAALACLLLPLAIFQMELLALALAALFAMVGLNRDLYMFFLRRRGAIFAIACIPLHLLYYLCSGFSYIYVWTSFRFSSSASRPGKAV